MNDLRDEYVLTVKNWSMGDVKRIPEALAAGCGADAPGSFAAWLSRKVEGK